MKRMPIVPGDRPLMVILHKYNYQKVLVFIATEGIGSNDPGKPHLYCFPDICSIFIFSLFTRILSRYFNTIIPWTITTRYGNMTQ